MILATVQPQKYETNMIEKTEEFGFDDMSVIIDIVQNRLYSNKKRTLVQEYMCNGRDANREAQAKMFGFSSRPIEVTVPSPFSLHFKVRDFGLGISHDRMYKVFIKYGASTKRSDNQQTGGFGIGSKIAFSYTSSFNVTTFIDGVKTVYLAHVGKNKKGNMTIIGQEETSEPNGTEISVPVQKEDVSEFASSVVRCSYFWTEHERPIIKNLGESHFHDFKYNKNSITLVDNYAPVQIGNGRFNLLVDGIIYPMDELISKINRDHDYLMSKLSELIASSKKVMIQVPNGFVQVSASRERVEDSAQTFENLIPLIKKIYSSFKDEYDENKNFNSFNEALVGAKDVSNIFNINRFKVGNWSLEFKNSGDPIILSTLFDKAEIYSLELTDNGEFKKVKPTRREKYYSNLKKIDYSFVKEQKVVEFNTVVGSRIIASRKLKQYMNKKSIKRVSVIDFKNLGEEEIREIVNNLGIVSVENLAYDKELVVAKKKTKTQVASNLIGLYKFERGVKNLVYFDKQDLKNKKIIYVEYDKLGTSFGFESLEKFFNNTLFVGATKSALKCLESMTNAQSFATWETGYKPDAKYLDSYVAQKLDSYKRYKFIAQLPQVKNPEVNALSGLYLQYENKRINQSIPDLVLGKIAQDESIKKVLQIIEEKVKMVQSKFPLLDKINLDYLTVDEKNDLIRYLNK